MIVMKEEEEDEEEENKNKNRWWFLEPLELTPPYICWYYTVLKQVTTPRTTVASFILHPSYTAHSRAKLGRQFVLKKEPIYKVSTVTG